MQSLTQHWITQYPRFDYRQYKGETDGYIMHTVKIVLHFFFNTTDFESCLIGVVNRGGDSDTNGALSGMLAGAFYGLETIPGQWLKKLDPGIKEAVERQVGLLLDTFPPIPLEMENL